MLIFDSTFCLIGLVLLLVMGVALLSPFEALEWWAGWSKRHLDPTEADSWVTAEPETTAPDDAHFIVYLTAIGGISAEDISTRERRFLKKLAENVPNAVIVQDVYPFSVSNNPLNGERQLAWLWQKLHQRRLKRRTDFLAALIFLRNLFQVAVSADPRYGPIYNVGVAREIAHSLFRHGYEVESNKPVYVMGWSGGAQIAVGVARYLNQAFQNPVRIISIGGVLTDDPAVAFVDHVYHLNGSNDRFPRVGDILYPGRWPIVPHSAWNKARRAGKITVIVPGPMKHTGRDDYFDRRAKLPNGQSYLEKTVEVIAGAIIGQVESKS